ncbi:MAG: nitroreductase/quinone reductase family protein [Candidatus Actinomarina sp.]
MWKILGKIAHLWPTWFYRFISNFHSKIIKFNFTKAGKRILGDNILLLETIGNKTKKLRRTPLAYVKVKEFYLVAASYSGSDKTPDWFYNLNTTSVYITIDGVRFEATYELVDDISRSDMWKHLDELYPTFKNYRKRTKRNIPLIKFSKVMV